MTLEAAPAGEPRFLRATLPWLVAAAALLLYLVTLNYGVTLNNLALVARINGWDWRPWASQPLLYLLTWPCRWLPAVGVPVALNLLAALCACFTLALLARSVALLPHDRIEQQRQLVAHPHALLSVPAAWVPIVFAAVALGLQLSFWENAVVGTGETLDLLLFAYVIRCLLEYRVDQRPRWLDRASLVYGLAMANNWLMVAFLPLFVVALLWTRPLCFFKSRFFHRVDQRGWDAVKPALTADLRFLVRMPLLGLAGLSLILLLPLVQALSSDFSLGFWRTLRATLGAYKTAVFLLARIFLRLQREAGLVLVSVSLLPILLLSIRWRTFTAGKSSARFDLVSFILHLAHAFLLLLCVWVAFDPSISPRHLGRRMGFPLSFLPLYYLGALSIGYYSGFFLLVFRDHARSRRVLKRAIGWAVPALVYVLLAVTLAGLALKNLPALRASNQPLLARYAERMVQSLPPAGAVVLADEPLRLAALETSLVRGTNASRYLLAETSALADSAYRARLLRQQPGHWPGLDLGDELRAAALAGIPTNGPLNALGQLQLLARLTQHHRVFCLQASFGLLPERFQLRPRGLLYELLPYPTNSIKGPPLSSAELGENEAFWKRATDTELRPILGLLDSPAGGRSGLKAALMSRAHLEMSPLPTARALAVWYSTALNHWGVTLQRQNRVTEATPCFSLALQLNPDNLCARINLQSNSNLLAGVQMTVNRSPAFLEQAGQVRSWPQMLAANGPVDDPSFCYQLALGYVEARLIRQAIQQLERVVALAPDDLNARLTVGKLLIVAGLPDQALEVAAAIEAHAKGRAFSPGAGVRLSFLQAEAWLASTNVAKASGIIESVLATYPDDPTLGSQAAELLAQYHSYSNALQLVDRSLKLTPENPFLLAQKGTLHLIAGSFSNAIPPFTQALSLTNLYPIRLNRALAYFRLGDLDAAEADYQALLQAFPKGLEAWHGLAEVARLRNDTNTAIRCYQQVLAAAQPGSEAARVVEARLKSLQPPAP